MYTITKTDLLIADPILAAEVKLLANDLKNENENVKLDYWITVQNIGGAFYVSADNGYDMTDTIKCSHTTSMKLFKLYAKGQLCTSV